VPDFYKGQAMTKDTPIRDLTAAARAGLSGNWGRSIGVSLVYLLLIAGASQIPLVGSLVQLAFAAPMMAGLYGYFLATLRRQPNPFELLFEGFNRFGTAWCAYMLVFLIMTAWAVPFGVLMAVIVALAHPDPTIFPVYTVWALASVGILVLCAFLLLLQMRYSLVLFVVADDSAVRARDAVRRSACLMRGNYWRLGLLWFRFIGWQVLAVLTFGIGLIWLFPYMTAATAAFYDDLSVKG
jgi:uncharacterized membrane protein